MSILSLFSCLRDTNEQLKKKIIGEWTYLKTVYKIERINSDELLPPPPIDKRTNRYIFFENNECENKIGHFKINSENEQKQSSSLLLRAKPTYEIDNDTLKIIDSSNKTLENQKIFSIIGDTLTFQISDTQFSIYLRTQYKINPNENYDKIIVSTSGCYGTCPILDISIDKNGEIIYFGHLYNTQNGLFTSKITKEEYKEIESTFKKADIPNLKDSYQANWTDDEEVTITFIKNNKIIKTISDYGREAPKMLIWAYSAAKYLNQQVKLVPSKTDKLNFPMSGLILENGQQICDLTKSESFYLLTELLKSKIVTQKFKKKYTSTYWNYVDKKEKIYTDGRYFKFTNKTFDIGYDFLAVNNLNQRFRMKNEYDR
ncbi:MAG: DUF6438 domain-containing protein [Cytophagales bacterium]